MFLWCWFGKIISRLVAALNSGKFLSEGLSRYRSVFGDFFISIVQVGEKSGKLSENLLHLSLELRKKKELQSKIVGALVYPIIIFVATIGITIFLVFFILPKILPVLQDLHVALPLSTRILIFIVNMSTQFGLYILGGGIILLICVRALFQFSFVRFFFHRIVLYIPIVSGLTRRVTLVDFSRSFGLLLQSGVSIVDALTISAGTIRNLYYRQLILFSVEHVSKGEQVADYFAKHQYLFPIMFSNLLKIGESTGHLESNLFYLSEYYEGEVDDSVRGLTAIMEPLLLLFMGLMVGFVAISIILPIYKISQPAV